MTNTHVLQWGCELVLVEAEVAQREYRDRCKEYQEAKHYRNVRPLHDAQGRLPSVFQYSQEHRPDRHNAVRHHLTYNQVAVRNVIKVQQLLASLEAAVGAVAVVAIKLDAAELVVDADVKDVFEGRDPVGPDPPVANRAVENKEAVEQNEDAKENRRQAHGCLLGRARGTVHR